MTHPTTEQLAALDEFRKTHGQRWKHILSKCWINSAYGPTTNSGLLQQLRNQFGPAWLVAYRRGDLQVGVLQSRNRTAQYVIADLAGNMLAAAEGVPSKKAARLVARSLKITLIESIL